MERFTANKFGLLNFWYYDEEEFQLSNGKIIFRGTNGSGKSVTTQSFIPLLLDGDKRPSRIDPFGSNARKIENYILINEDENDRISYLYIEFVKPESQNYITIGMGLRGRKGKPLESWYFILKDGRRINHNFKLYKYSGEKFPLTAKQLENELGEGNVFTKSQREYMEKVNENLFGYSDIESYKDLLNLLIQLRSPKLSKDFKPTVIYDILKQSLNTLSDDDLRSMSEAMDNMDSLNLRLEELRKSIDACGRISKVFDVYNKDVLYDKAKRYKNKLSSVKKQKKDIENLKSNLELKLQEIGEKENLVRTLKDELDIAIRKEETLRDNEGFTLRDKITKEEAELNELNKYIDSIEKKYDLKYEARKKKEEHIKELECIVYKKNNEFKDVMSDEEYYRNESYFEHFENLKEAPHSNGEYDFNNILSSVEEYDLLVRNAYNIICEYENMTSDLNDLEEKQNTVSAEVKLKENALNESREYLTNVKCEYIEKINMYNMNLRELKISEDDSVRLYKEINEIYEESDCIIIYKLLDEFAGKITKSINEIKFNNENNINKLNSEIKDIEDEINLLINSKEAFDEEDALLKTKKVLIDNKIPYEDFYKCIDFISNTDEHMKKSIEGSLCNMGILTSIIIPYTYKEKALEVLNENTYKIIFTDVKSEEKNICGLFKLEECDFNKKYGEEVIKVLKSISLNNPGLNNTYITHNNDFGIGIINGKSSRDYSLKYIGVNSREAYRKSRIENLQAEINAKSEKKDDYLKNVDLLNERIKFLNEEIDGFPKDDDIKASIKVIDENINELNKENSELEFLNGKINKLKSSYQEIKLKLFKASEGIKIPKNKKSYEDALKGISEYRKSINALKDICMDITYKNKEICREKDYIEEIDNDLDSINDDLYTNKERRRQKENHIKSLNDAIKAYDLGALEEEYAKVTQVLNVYPKKIEIYSGELVAKKTGLDYEKKDIETREKQFNIENEELELIRDILADEIELKYVEDISEMSFEECVKFVLENYERVKKSSNDISTALGEILASNKGYLADYHPRTESIFVYEKCDDDRKNRIMESAIRTDIKIKFNKKEISLYKLIEYLNNFLEDQNLLISQKEREVFEDILINTLSSKINAKIYKTKGWVKEIDSLMKSMNTSSGFKLYLTWKPKKAASEGEIDIKELTDILSTPHFMTEEQRGRVADHFREKLKMQKRISGKDGNSRNYHTIIKEVLDYREWFEFQLSFSKPTENKKELTDNEFFKLSGGEKAMAMYVPLFAAVNVRYNGSDKKDAPRVISLDEAFAGVDEDNISSMFALLEQLELDYVLNSQVLWGTYDSVKNLSIYELIRQGEEIVIPIKYYWNGKIKTMEMEV